MSEFVLPWHSSPQTFAGKVHAEAHRTGFTHAFVSVIDDICQIEHQAAAAARAESEALREALIWCSGSPSFQPEGEAREGWVTICQPLLAARDGE
jgi:hypothetical protein